MGKCFFSPLSPFSCSLLNFPLGKGESFKLPSSQEQKEEETCQKCKERELKLPSLVLFKDVERPQGGGARALKPQE